MSLIEIVTKTLSTWKEDLDLKLKKGLMFNNINKGFGNTQSLFSIFQFCEELSNFLYLTVLKNPVFLKYKI